MELPQLQLALDLRVTRLHDSPATVSLPGFLASHLLANHPKAS
jgi:hypothetical protein